MFFRVELRKDVVRFIRHYCTDKEVDAFYKAIRQISEDPIGRSEATYKPRLSRYMLHFFRFAENIAVFDLNIAKKRIRVLSCRKTPSKPGRGREPHTGEQPP